MKARHLDPLPGYAPGIGRFVAMLTGTECVWHRISEHSSPHRGQIGEIRAGLDG